MAETTKNILYKKGSKGEEVGKIQTALGDYYTKFGSTVDNDYGNDTAGGVWDWQTQWNKDNPNDQIKVDGIVGPQTYPRLMKWYADKQAAATPTTGQEQQVTTPVAEAVPAPATPVTEQSAAATPAADPNSSAAIQQSQIDAMNKNIDPMTGKPIPTVDEKPDEFKYRFRWNQPGVSLDSMLETLTKSKDPTSKRQIIDDYLRYMHDNNLPVDYYTLNDIVNKSHDLSLSPADEEKEKKRIANKERWDKVSNFLLHLGNAIGNVGGGGYASMALEDPVKWGERQRLLKEKGLEQRRLNNQSIYQQMRQGWADQRTHELQKQRLENEKLKVGLQEELAKARKANDELRTQLLQKQIDKLNTMTPLQADTEKSKAEKNRQQGKAAITRANKTGNGGGRGKQDSKTTTTYNRDSDGKVTKSERVTTYGKPASTSGNKGKVSTGVKWRTRK